jgi:single-stranded DNA-binding protein
MIDALISGKLFGAPQKRTSKNGNDFVTGKMRTPGPDGVPAFVTFIAFRDHVCAALLELGDGASIAIAGELKVSTYQAKDGSTKPSLDLTAHEILTQFHITRRRRAMAREEGESAHAQQPPAKTTAAAGQEDFNDSIPF